MTEDQKAPISVPKKKSARCDKICTYVGSGKERNGVKANAPKNRGTLSVVNAEPMRCNEESLYSVISRMTRHGFPAANTPSGMSLVTTLPAPMTVFEPIFTPGQMIAPPPIHTSDPISIGLLNSCFLRNWAFIG